MARIRAFERPEATAERNAREVFRSVDQNKGVNEYSLAQKAFHDNRERLKAERLAREAIVSRGETARAREGS